MKECSSYFLKEMKRSRFFFCCLLSVSGKNDYILLLSRHHQINILPSRRDIAKSKILFHKKKSKKVFALLLHSKNPLRKHTSFGKSPAAWRNLAATQIFLCLFRSTKFNAFFLFGLRISKTKRRKDICDTLLLFSLKGLSLTISNSTYPRLLVQGDASYPTMKIFYHIPPLALFTAAVFICRLLVNLRPASQEAVIGKNLTYFDLLGCLFVFFSRLNFNLIEPVGN